MLLVDVHAHLDDAAFAQDLPDVLKRAQDACVKAVISNGLHLENNKIVQALSKKYPLIKPAYGLYPTYAEQVSDEKLEETLVFIKKNKPICIGEIGLDYKEPKDKERQQVVFRRLLQLAKAMDVPVCIHSRKAEEDCIRILQEEQVKKVVMHCFSGKLRMVESCVRQGWYFSIPPNIVFSSHFQEMVKKLPLSKLLTETDAPYLGPKKGERNEPAFVMETIKQIAMLKSLTEIEVANAIFMNYQDLFS
ncbi:TatD family hydrolase [Candidatus Woesearchaeota archaeon]|nr:TatD family hydrolase [Candidatus Woesearchaeota archaeon]